jgi:hypothetical protein
MNYSKIYQNLCERGKLRLKSRGSNLEKHHIIPTFFFRDNKRNLRHKDGIYDGNGEHVGNITYLTPREHFIAHLLLCKIWKNTKWEYRCYTSVKMFLIGGGANKKRNVFENSSKLYEKYRIKANLKISTGKSGTMPAKDFITGERVGIVEIDHPNVVSGKWVHITKGMNKNAEQRREYSLRQIGLANGNSKFSDRDLLNSYKQCCYHYGKLVNLPFWVLYSKRNDLPYLTTWKSFRFDGRGARGMIDDFLMIAKIENRNIEIITNYNTGVWRKFAKEEKEKWGSK